MSTQSKPSPEQWEAQRATIESLWIDEDKTLSDLVQCMKGRGLSATSTQYTRQLRKWKISKNLHEKDWIYISREVTRRSREGKQSDVFFRQRKLEAEKVRKETRRHDLPLMRPLPTPVTSANIRVCTPPNEALVTFRPEPLLITDELPSVEFPRLLSIQGQ